MTATGMTIEDGGRGTVDGTRGMDVSDRDEIGWPDDPASARSRVADFLERWTETHPSRDIYGLWIDDEMRYLTVDDIEEAMGTESAEVARLRAIEAATRAREAAEEALADATALYNASPMPSVARITLRIDRLENERAMAVAALRSALSPTSPEKPEEAK